MMGIKSMPVIFVSALSRLYLVFMYLSGEYNGLISFRIRCVDVLVI